MASCQECGEEYSDKRRDLGYKICLDCGDEIAREKSIAKSKRIVPLFNKGPIQYLTDGENLKDIGK